MQGKDMQLHKVSIRLVEWEQCQQLLPYITQNMLCAGDPHTGKDTCKVTAL